MQVCALSSQAEAVICVLQDDNTKSGVVSLVEVENLERNGALKWNLHADLRTRTNQPTDADADCPSDDEENGWCPEDDDRGDSADEEAAESDNEDDDDDGASGTVQTGVTDAPDHDSDDTPDLGLDGGHRSRQRPDDDDGRCSSSSSSLNESLVEAVRQLRRKILPTLRSGRIVSAPEGFAAVNVSEHTHACESASRLTLFL